MEAVRVATLLDSINGQTLPYRLGKVCRPFVLNPSHRNHPKHSHRAIPQSAQAAFWVVGGRSMATPRRCAGAIRGTL
jgi:hypothetical protein